MSFLVANGSRKLVMDGYEQVVVMRECLESIVLDSGVFLGYSLEDLSLGAVKLFTCSGTDPVVRGPQEDQSGYRIEYPRIKLRL